MRKNQRPDTASGRLGEEAAAQLLAGAGYEILCRNYRSRFGEIDIIARKDSYLVFAEVKTREPHSLVHPLEAVTPAKQRKLLRTAGLYLAANPTKLQPRFDVIAVIMEKGAVLEITHLPGAFTG